MTSERFRMLLVRAVGLPFVLLTLIGTLFGVQIARLTRALRRVDHSDVAVARVRDLEVMLLEQRAAASAYFVTGSENDRTVALAYAPETRLAKLAADTQDPTRRSELARAETACAKWGSELRTALTKPSAHSAADFVAHGSASLVPLLQALDAFSASERTARAERSVAADREARWTLRGGVAVFVAVGLLLGVIVRRQLRQVQETYEKALERQRADERMNEMLVGILGHDLQSPLSAIAVSAQGLLRAGSASDVQTRLIGHISSAARRMHRLIVQMLDMTRSRLGGGIVVSRRPTSITSICREIAEEAESANPGRTVEVHGDGDIEAPSDPDRLGQVLANLVGNALRHGDPRAPVDLTVERREDEVEVAVHNEGPAIPSDEVAHIFDPFRRASTAGADGLGLGLYIADRIVRAHGGRIDVESAPARGTTFRVHLPLRGNET